MPNARSLLVAVAVLATAVLVAACGEDRGSETGAGGGTTGETGGQTGTTATGAAVATVQVGETEYKLNPANPQIKKSGVIEFQVKNDGQVDHALEIEAPNGEIQTDPIAPGESTTLKAKLKPGTYEWYCPIDDHKGMGMRGTIVVAGGGSSGGTGTGTGTTEDNGGGGGGGGDDQRKNDPNPGGGGSYGGGY